MLARHSTLRPKDCKTYPEASSASGERCSSSSGENAGEKKGAASDRSCSAVMVEIGGSGSVELDGQIESYERESGNTISSDTV